MLAIQGSGCADVWVVSENGIDFATLAPPRLARRSLAQIFVQKLQMLLPLQVFAFSLPSQLLQLLVSFFVLSNEERPKQSSEPFLAKERRSYQVDHRKGACGMNNLKQHQQQRRGRDRKQVRAYSEEQIESN